MKCKSLWMKIALLGLVFLLVAGCAQGTGGSSGGAEVKLVFAHPYTDNDHRALGYEKWAELVHERSNGSIEIEIHSNGSLVDLPEGYDSVSTGTVDIFANVSLYMSSMIPELEQFDPVGIYDTTQWKELNEAVTPVLDEVLEEHNMKFLHTDYQGPSAIISVTPEPIIKPVDWKGVRWRDAGIHLGRMINQLGGSSQTIPLGELSTAISNGMVDAVFQGYSFVRSMNYYDSMDHIVMMPHVSNAFGVIAINLDKWNELAPEQQQILIETGNEILPVYEEIGQEAYDEILDLVETGSAELHILSEEEEKAIVDVSLKFNQELYDNASDKGKELYEILEQHR